MSQPTQPGQPAQPQPSGSGKGFSKSVGIGLIIVALLGLGAAGYTVMNPHVITVTQQQLLTNTLSLTNTQTQTVTSLGTQTVTSVVTSTNAVTNVGSTYAVYTGSSGYYSQSNQYCNYNGCYSNPGPNYQSCSYNGCYYNGLPGYNNYYYTNVCQTVGGNNTVQCSGYLYHNQGGCIVLSIPIDNGYWFETRVYQYYTLQNLPGNYQNTGGWFTVTGQMNQGYNVSPTGAACPGNYIVVSSITQ